MAGRLWRIFNSNLVLWLLSAAVLTLLPFLYANATERRDSAERMREKRGVLVLEMIGRIEQIAEPAPHLANTGFSAEHYRQLLLVPPTIAPSEVAGVRVYSLYPEYAFRPLTSLAQELVRLSKDRADRKQSADSILGDIQNITDMLNRSKTDEARSTVRRLQQRLHQFMDEHT